MFEAGSTTQHNPVAARRLELSSKDRRRATREFAARSIPRQPPMGASNVGPLRARQTRPRAALHGLTPDERRTRKLTPRRRVIRHRRAAHRRRVTQVALNRKATLSPKAVLNLKAALSREALQRPRKRPLNERSISASLRFSSCWFRFRMGRQQHRVAAVPSEAFRIPIHLGFRVVEVVKPPSHQWIFNKIHYRLFKQ